MLILFLYLVLFEAADHLLSMIPFKTCRQSRIFRMIVNYLLAFAGWYWLGWITLKFLVHPDFRGQLSDFI